MFHKKSRRLQRQASFSGVASKLMDATSEKSRKLSRQINKMARVQEEKELQEKREQEEAAQEEKKKKEEGFARSIITRKLSIFGSYRKMSFSTRKPIIIVEVSNHPPPHPNRRRSPQSTPFLQTSLFLDRFCREFWLSITSCKSGKKIIVFLMVWSYLLFLFVIIVLWMHTHMCFHFRGRKYSKKMLKIRKNKLTGVNAVVWTKYGGCTHWVRGWNRLSSERNSYFEGGLLWDGAESVNERSLSRCYLDVD